MGLIGIYYFFVTKIVLLKKGDLMEELKEIRNMIAEDEFMESFIYSIDSLIEIYQRLCDTNKDIYDDNNEIKSIHRLLSYLLDTEFIRFTLSQLDLLDSFIRLYMKQIMKDDDYLIYIAYDKRDYLMENIIIGSNIIIPGYVQCSKTRAFKTMMLLMMSREFLRTVCVRNTIKANIERSENE